MLLLRNALAILRGIIFEIRAGCGPAARKPLFNTGSLRSSRAESNRLWQGLLVQGVRLSLTHDQSSLKHGRIGQIGVASMVHLSHRLGAWTIPLSVLF